MKYIHRFRSENEYKDYVNNNYKEPFLCNKVGNGVETTYNEATYNLKYLAEPLTLEFISGGTLY